MRRRARPGARAGGPVAAAGRELLVPGPDGPIPVTEEGQGPAILLLHRGSADRSTWAGVAAQLSRRFRVLRFDRWTYRDGHAAGAPAGADTMAAEVADVLAVAAATGERPPLVGHSSGAVVALESALAAPSAFTGMVLYEPPVAVTEPLGGEALRQARAALDAGDPGRAIAIHVRDPRRRPADGRRHAAAAAGLAGHARVRGRPDRRRRGHRVLGRGPGPLRPPGPARAAPGRRPQAGPPAPAARRPGEVARVIAGLADRLTS
jgi:pimeloyl-ACP methyl ester carboxylesterase